MILCTCDCLKWPHIWPIFLHVLCGNLGLLGSPTKRLTCIMVHKPTCKLQKLIYLQRQLKIGWFSMCWIRLIIYYHPHPSHVTNSSRFWPNNFGCKTPGFSFKPTRPLVELLPPNSRSSRLGVPPKLQKSTCPTSTLHIGVQLYAYTGIPEVTLLHPSTNEGL